MAMRTIKEKICTHHAQQYTPNVCSLKINLKPTKLEEIAYIFLQISLQNQQEPKRCRSWPGFCVQSPKLVSIYLGLEDTLFHVFWTYSVLVGFSHPEYGYSSETDPESLTSC
ncbi:hypothetical protein AMECASPLE_011424 [Ameca splendens]|uniref:Uncharacterized protein n=1 Tax=Ameca splendens TaxID=208324 RepID=A0ABV0YYQ9_9TELE